MRRVKFYLTVFFYLVLFVANAQSNANIKLLELKRTNQPIVVDGILNEASWQLADSATGFWQQFPFDTSYANAQSTVRVLFSDKFLYIGIWCAHQGEYTIQSLKRDFALLSNDNFSVYLDPFNDGTNGFNFSVTPYGTMRESSIILGEFTETQWDNKWYANAKRLPGGWTAEMAIPFKTLRYNPANTTWKINFSRTDAAANEISTWVPMPRNFRLSNLAKTATLQWPEPPPKPGLNVSLIPYVSGSYNRDAEKGTEDGPKPNIGLDAKIALTPGLNLDLTTNPDFSQVEVDRQVINISRFDLFFPERRQFFIENNDLFDQFGFYHTRPFFSRRIGLERNVVTNQSQNIPLLFGARLTGKLNRNWRVGFMSIQQQAQPDIDLRSQNYTVAAIQRRIFSRSNIGAIFVNRQAFYADSTDDFSLMGNDYNRLAGLDYKLHSENGVWRGHAFYHRVFAPNLPSGAPDAHGVDLLYSVPKVDVRYTHEYTGEAFRPETGFVPRTNFWFFNPDAQYKIYPAKGSLQWHGPFMLLDVYTDTDFNLWERRALLAYKFNFKTTATLDVRTWQQHINLRRPFDPSGSRGHNLAANTSHTMQLGSVAWATDKRKGFFMENEITAGQWYGGWRLSYQTELRQRLQPWAILALNVTYHHFELDAPWLSTDLWLIGPRTEITFNKELFWSTFVQYNQQTTNFNINTRLQWRFAPVSDLFIVYTENLFTPDPTVADPPVINGEKNRALVVKLSYWFNL